MGSKSKSTILRYAVYVGLLLLLTAGIVIAVLRVGLSGAWLTGEGDWQDLAGKYSIGIIDYTIKLNEEKLIEQEGNIPKSYRMVVPIQGAVRFFDPTVTAPVRSQEFNTGATLMRIKIINNSGNLIEIGGTLSLTGAGNGNKAIRFLPLPDTLPSAEIPTLDRRKFVVDTLKLTDPSTVAETAALGNLATAYETFYGNTTPATPLSTYTATFPSRSVYTGGATGSNVSEFIALVWTEYDGGMDYNTDEPHPAATMAPAASPVIQNRSAQFSLTVNVAQRESTDVS
ncbi:MAG: hypothetical protein RRY64_00290 [Oscillospiraceae bacterium]